MKNNRFGIGIVGCGNISEHYAMTMQSFPQLELIGVTDIDILRAEGLASRFNVKVFSNLEEMLKACDVDIVLNLTIFQAHYSVTKASLNAGKHVFSEKPLALTNSETFELVELAKKQGQRLACAPSVFLGDAQETVWRFLETGALGDVRLVFAEVNQGRIEAWHPAPEPFYQVGPIIDVGIYAVTLTTALFGPISRVRAFGKILMPNRQIKEGRVLTLLTPDFYEIVFELENGIIFHLNANYYVDTGERDIGYQVHGDKGSLYLASWHNYDASVFYRQFGDKTNYTPIPLIREPFSGPKKVEWCRGLNSFANSIRYDRPQVIQGEHAAHVMEAILAAHKSAKIEKPVSLKSTFIKPDLQLVKELNRK